MELPTDKKYKILYIDPPWEYNDECHAGERGAIFKYPLMNMDELKKLPIDKIADDDCIMFLWVTFPKLDEIFESGLIKHWGFQYKTNAFTWVKRNRKGLGWFTGMGRWTRSNAEICLLAVKGNPKRINADVHSVINTRIEEHSKKPAITRDRIVQLCGDLPRIEIFARQAAPGWAAWGNEIGCVYTPIEENKFFTYELSNS